MAYQSPGGAASNAIEAQLQLQAAQKRQAMLDQLETQKVADLSAYRREELDIRHTEAEQRAEQFKEAQKDKKAVRTQKSVDSMVKGDIVSPDLIAAAQEHGIRLPTSAMPPPALPDTRSMQTGQPIVPQDAPPMIAEPQPQVYGGGKAETLKAEEDAKQEAYINSLPDGPLKQAAMYELRTNRNIPAGALPPKDVHSASFNEYSDYKREETTAGRTPLTFDAWADKDANRKKPSAGSSEAQQLREENARNQAHQYAVTELNKIATPFESQLTNLASAEEVLREKSPAGDAHVAPMILKSLVAGAGSGFRMTQSEINQVVGGRSRWQDLSAALRKWETDPSKATLFDDAQRADFQKLIDKVRSKAQMQYKKISSVRHDINNAKDAREIQKYQTKLQDDLFSADQEPEDPNAVPTVGGTFQGGKVLSIVPVPKK